VARKHKDTVRKQFARTVEAFSKFAVRDAPDILAEQVDFAKPQATDSALDVACGPGKFVLSLAPRVHFARGIDLTPEMLRQAREFQCERGIANAFFDCGDADQLPYASASFDLVTCQYAFHHMQKPRGPLGEMLRVLKPGGRIVLIDALAPESDAKWELHNRIELLRDPSHAETLRLTSFLEMFDQLGLEVARQSIRRRPRSFHQWMLRAGIQPPDPRYAEARGLIENSANGDKAGFSPKPDGDDITITHIEALFLLGRKEV
jgi:ubiquinone/menaquinone biosynthesis C-methylase UbiE